jgi:MFS family permease
MGRATGAFHGAFLLGSAFGPTVGGLAAGTLGLRGPFFLYAGFCVAAGVVALLLLRGAPGQPAGAASPSSGGTGRGRAAPVASTGHGRSPAAQVPASAPPLRLTRTLLAALSGGFALWWLVSGFRFALVPLYAQEQLGLDSGAIGMGVTVSAVATLLVLWPAGLVADRFGRRLVGVPAFVGLALAAALLLLADGLSTYLLANAVVGAVHGAASVVPGALLADATPPGRAGEASGISHLASDLGGVVGPVAIGAVVDLVGYPAAAALAVAPALVAAGAIAAARPADAGTAAP